MQTIFWRRRVLVFGMTKGENAAGIEKHTGNLRTNPTAGPRSFILQKQMKRPVRIRASVVVMGGDGMRPDIEGRSNPNTQTIDGLAVLQQLLQCR